MKISLETIRQTYAAGRNYANYFLGVATTLGLLSSAQNKTIMDSLSDIAAGIGQIVHGFTSIWQVGTVVLGPVIGIVLAQLASHSATAKSQAASLAASASAAPSQSTTNAQVALLTAVTAVEKQAPDMTIQGKIVASPEVANAVPSNKVVSQ